MSFWRLALGLIVFVAVTQYIRHQYDYVAHAITSPQPLAIPQSPPLVLAPAPAPDWTNCNVNVIAGDRNRPCGLSTDNDTPAVFPH